MGQIYYHGNIKSISYYCNEVFVQRFAKKDFTLLYMYVLEDLTVPISFDKFHYIVLFPFS